jgi:hypothetical protein
MLATWTQLICKLNKFVLFSLFITLIFMLLFHYIGQWLQFKGEGNVSFVALMPAVVHLEDYKDSFTLPLSIVNIGQCKTLKNSRKSRMLM